MRSCGRDGPSCRKRWPERCGNYRSRPRPRPSASPHNGISSHRIPLAQIPLLFLSPRVVIPMPPLNPETYLFELLLGHDTRRLSENALFPNSSSCPKILSSEYQLYACGNFFGHSSILEKIAIPGQPPRLLIVYRDVQHIIALFLPVGKPGFSNHNTAGLEDGYG